mgnify:CR=1 FL=1
MAKNMLMVERSSLEKQVSQTLKEQQAESSLIKMERADMYWDLEARDKKTNELGAWRHATGNWNIKAI